MHIAIIMDGNRRWAKKHGEPSVFGHARGAETLDTIVRAAAQHPDITVLSVFALSTENLHRTPLEVSGIFRLLKNYINEKGKELESYHISVRFSGDTTKIPSDIGKQMDALEKATEGGAALLLNICIAYGGRDEVLRAAKKLSRSGEVFTEENFENELDTAGMPPVDLMIRTGGRKRMSNFLLWQSAYAEIYFTDTLWPDFSSEELQKAVNFFREQVRTYGK